MFKNIISDTYDYNAFNQTPLRVYVGVNNVAKLVRKIWIGSRGLAKSLSYLYRAFSRKQTKELLYSRSNLAAANAGNYALFAGGTGDNGRYVESVDASFSSSYNSTLSESRSSLSSISTNNYALFGGGKDSSGNEKRTVDAYDSSLTSSTPTQLYDNSSNPATTMIGNYALFGGGGYNGTTATTSYATNVTSSTHNFVDAYNNELTKSSATALTNYKCCLAASNVGNYALFAGGCSTAQPNYNQYSGNVYYTTTYYDTVDAYNASLTKTSATALSVARRNLLGASTNSYAIFAGGYGDKTVDAYDSSLTRSILTSLPRSYSGSGNGTFANGLAVFIWDYIYTYDDSLTQQIPTAKTTGDRTDHAVTTFNSYVLCGAGSGTNYLDIFD